MREIRVPTQSQPVIKDNKQPTQIYTGFFEAIKRAINALLFTAPTASVTGDYEVSAEFLNGSIVICDTSAAAIAVTLPAISGLVRRVTVVNRYDGANNVTVSSAFTIDGAAADAFAPGMVRTYVSTGSEWLKG